MLTLPLGPTYYAQLQFSDADSCVAWLETVPLARLADAHEMVSAQIGLVARTEIPALERMRVLEILYQTAKHLQDEFSRRFIGRALPLSIVEYSVWNTVVDLWRSLYDGYHACLRRCVRDDATLAHAPLLALRCIELTAAAIREHHRVYRAVPAALWKRLHDSYANAERHGLVTADVPDPLRASAITRTCAGAYARALLAHLSNPYTMSPRQMDVMYRWAELWESLVHIGLNPTPPGLTPVLAVDLRSCAPAGASHRAEPGPAVRYLGLEQLGQTLRGVLTLLRQGHDPAALGLGDDCQQPGCERLLTLLYIQWCGSGIGQLGPQSEHGEDARACVGFHIVVQQLASEAEAFRSGTASIRTAYGPLTEHWSVMGVSAPGFISVARGPECDERIEHHQLVAIKRRSASAFQLAVAQWLKHEEHGELSIGLRVLPGVPHMSALRPLDDETASGSRTSAIVLPAAPEMRTPATLVLAPGLFSKGRVFELVSGTLRKVRLLRLAERGADFERAVFELAN
ncbi:MAG: hypothetical protein EHM59_06620 [Betaproteobacteria bacterium]|nr:MAG: hypothetical protein EHM59_06620 [Betaproteobacteria bacterium]